MGPFRAESEPKKMVKFVGESAACLVPSLLGAGGSYWTKGTKGDPGTKKEQRRWHNTRINERLHTATHTGPKKNLSMLGLKRAEKCGENLNGKSCSKVQTVRNGYPLPFFRPRLPPPASHSADPLCPTSAAAPTNPPTPKPPNRRRGFLPCRHSATICVSDLCRGVLPPTPASPARVAHASRPRCMCCARACACPSF